MKCLKTTCIILAVVLCAGTVSAQDGVSQNMSIQAGYGTVTVGGVQWQRFSFRPDIPIGNFGIGFDIELFIDNEGKISDKGWDFSTTNTTWETLIRKIYYVRYGQPRDPFYVRAGALDDVTLGYGLIMDGYRNTLSYPADKKLGVDLAINDLGTFGIDVQAMINDIGDFKNNGAVVGGRVAFEPLGPMETPLLNRLTVGVTAVRDINQYAGLEDSDDDGYPDFQDGFPDNDKLHLDTDGDGITDAEDPDADGDNLTDPWYTDARNMPTLDPNVEQADMLNIRDETDGVSVWGFDVGLPLLEGAFNLDLYGQYANIHTGDDANEGGWGIGAPGLRLFAGEFLGQIEYRHFDGRFRPQYFDHLYEHERVTLSGTTPTTKEMTLPDDTLNGVYGRAGYTFFQMVDFTAGYQYMTGDTSYQDLTGRLRVLDRVLMNVPKISLLEGYFYNTYVDPDRYGIFEKTPNTFYGTRVGFEITSGMMIVWDTRYTFSPNDTGGLERNRFVSIETVMSVR